MVDYVKVIGSDVDEEIMRTAVLNSGFYLLQSEEERRNQFLSA
ncbi:hypothetical protein ACFLR1_01785 [Bacteroidota bacterium]